MPTRQPDPVLDDKTEALIAQLVADSLRYFANRALTTTWNPELGPSQIGASYQDYEEPLSSYERQILECPNGGDTDKGWNVPDVRIRLFLCLSICLPLLALLSKGQIFETHNAPLVLDSWLRIRLAY